MAHKNKTNLSPYRQRQDIRTTQGVHKKPNVIYELEEANDRLLDVFKNHGFGDFPHNQRQKLAHFYQILMQHQEKENFTRLLSIKDIAIKHFIDCLIITRFSKLSFPLLDVGTGPGFPGIPLKIIFPEEKIILAEGVQKRVEFLKIVREEMFLKNLDIIGRNINPEFMYPVRGVITRALEDVSNTLSNVIHSLQVGGLVFLMKGPNVDPEIDIALKKWSEFYKLENDIAYELPNTPQKRRLVIFKKIKVKPIDFETLYDEEWENDEKY